MQRIEGLDARQAGWSTRLVYWMTRRKVGRLVQPIKITAHSPRLLRAVGTMEMAQAAVKSVDAALKWLVKIKAATLIGCPY